MQSSNKGILYYGSRNHQVRRLNMENMEVLVPFEPPHFDTVTCLASMGDYVISGSKDKNLKLWSVESAVKNLKSTSYAHNDYINTLSAGTDYPLFYSGSRNGQVKVGTILKEKI
jgi:WD40 repeat protein